MSFLDSLIYSFSNIFSIGPDLYDDGDECCGGVGPGGTCCKNFSPQINTPSPPILTCQQKQELYACHCPSDDTHGPDAPWRTIKLVVCGQLERQETTVYDTLSLLERFLQGPSQSIKTCTVALDQQCHELLLALSSCVFVLSDTKKDRLALNRLLGWLNEQILSSHHQPLKHLIYGIVCLDREQYTVAALFQQKLDQLGATAVAGTYLQQQSEGLEQWAKDFYNGLQQNRTFSSSPSSATAATATMATPDAPASAGCTHGMVDVEELGQVARKIKQTKEQQVVTWTNLRGRSKRMIELDHNATVSSPQKAAPTTGTATLVPTYGSMSSSLEF